ncbi:DsbA family protein [Kitasatospora viridis]|uniref:Protein-disulfide isomerase n=1 Tax=Kitasatospora viridis TaxID=281105 RepID=A0A561UN12_9ACTN|nr:thioredoxin domain-containing protein [Kitasatospora viridis]TWG00749.1 protein-disulfide isomerase [Kitasatospora viridis]
MSSTTPNANKKKPTAAEQQAARRERLRQAQLAEEKQQRRNKIVIAGSAVFALLLVGGIGAAVVTSGSDHKSGGSAASSAPVVTPANASGPGGTVVTYGKADAPHTLDVYEDFRCPICKKFETTNGPLVQQLADAGDYKINYHLAAFLDDNLGGKGSINALAAAGAALNEGVDQFKKFHDELYANQPAETTDGFGDTNKLLDLAGQVPGLKTDAFTSAVQGKTYLPWAQKVAAAFDDSGVTGTPTMKFDGKALNLFDSAGNPVSADDFKKQVGAQ